MNKISVRTLNIKYWMLELAFWSFCAAVIGYATVFLLDRGFDSSMIGIILAAGNVLGALMQPVFGTIIDSSERVTLLKSIVLLGALAVVLSAALVLTGTSRIMTAFLFLSAEMVMWILVTLTSSVSVYYVNRGVYVDFGLARGLGSLSYSVSSYILGLLTVRYGTVAIPLLAMAVSAALMLLALTLPELGAVSGRPGVPDPALRSEGAKLRPAAGGETDATGGETLTTPEPGVITGKPGAVSGKPGAEPVRPGASGGGGFITFVRNHWRFSVILLGLTVMFISPNIYSSYMFQIVVSIGGDSADMGTALALMAAAEVPAMFVFSRLVKRFDVSLLLSFALICYCIKGFAVMLAPNVYVLYAIQLLQTVSFGIFAPASVYYVNELMGENDKVKGLAYMSSTNTLGAVFGTLIGGFLIKYAGTEALKICGFAAAAAGGVPAVIFINLLRKER